MSICRLTLATLALAAVSASTAFAQAPQATAAPAPATASAPAAPAPPAAAVATPGKTYYEAVRVSVDGKVENQGSVSLELTPLGGAPKVVNVNVLPKMKGKDVARDLGKELTIAAGSGYKVKVSGDEVRISKLNKKSENFALTMAGQTATGIAVLIKRD